MTNEHENDERTPLQALGEEFARVARAEPRSRVRSLLQRRLLVPLAALALAGGAGGLALAGGIGGEPEAQKVQALWGPNGAYPECPTEVSESLVTLNDLSDYSDTPGYPVAGCPTVEELEADENAMVILELGTLEQRRAAE